MTDETRLYQTLPQLCVDAGHAVMDVRATAFAVEAKDDQSPVTLADTQAEAVILEGLGNSYSDIPVVAEEAMSARRRPDTSGDIFFLVDPLDVTKELIGGFSDFTVIIALIVDCVPVA